MIEKIKQFLKTKLGVAIILSLLGGATIFAQQFGCSLCVDILESLKPAPYVEEPAP